jgi:hypothetical protein
MRFGWRADVHLVEGSPWAEAIISVLSARSPYRPWRTDDSASIRPGDKLIAVVDTDPVSVLAAVAVVGGDGDIQAAFVVARRADPLHRSPPQRPCRGRRCRHRALREERESDVMAKRREDLRGRLGPIHYGSQKMPIDSPSESADVVTARAGAFHELRALIDKHRLDSTRRAATERSGAAGLPRGN